MAVDRSYRSKSSEERRTTATNSLQSRVVSRRSGHAAPLPLLPLCSLPSTCARPRTLSFFFYLCVPVVAVRIDGRLSADETRSFYLRARTRSSTIADALVQTLLTTIHRYLSATRILSHTHTGFPSVAALRSSTYVYGCLSLVTFLCVNRFLAIVYVRVYHVDASCACVAS